MTAASRSLATAPWGARFASGLLPPSYTTSWGRTGKRVFGARERQGDLMPRERVPGAEGRHRGRAFPEAKIGREAARRKIRRPGRKPKMNQSIVESPVTSQGKNPRPIFG